MLEKRKPAEACPMVIQKPMKTTCKTKYILPKKLENGLRLKKGIKYATL